MAEKWGGSVMDNWTDENGRNVKIKSYISKIYIDEELCILQEDFNINFWNGEVAHVGKEEMETLISRLLKLYKVEGYLFGIRKNDLGAITRCYGEYDYTRLDFHIGPLIDSGYLRAKKVLGEDVLFPTRKFMKGQNIPGRWPIWKK